MIFDRIIVKERISYMINKKDVLSLLGYKRDKTKVSSSFAEKIDFILKETQEKALANAVYIVRKISKMEEDTILFKNTDLKIKSRDIVKLLSDSFAAIFFGVTIGWFIDNKIKELKERGVFNEALIYDAVGSEAVEGAANSINSFFDIEARQNRYSLTRRFSPGYGDLHISFQKELFKELSLEKIGVSITDTNLLLPQKTITAIIGVEK